MKDFLFRFIIFRDMFSQHIAFLGLDGPVYRLLSEENVNMLTAFSIYFLQAVT